MRDPVIAGVLSLIIPGVGQIYNGRVLAGILWLILRLDYGLGRADCSAGSATSSRRTALTPTLKNTPSAYKRHYQDNRIRRSDFYPVICGYGFSAGFFGGFAFGISSASITRPSNFGATPQQRRQLRHRKTHSRYRIDTPQNRATTSRNPNIGPATIRNRKQRCARDRRLNLPRLAAVFAVNDASLLAHDQHIVRLASATPNRLPFDAAFEIFPRYAAIVSPQHDSTRADNVATLRIGKRKRVQPLLQILIDALPVLAAIFRAQDRAAGSDRDAMQRIDKLHVLKPVERVRLLKLPAHAFVLRMPDGSARAHDPTFRRRNK